MTGRRIVSFALMMMAATGCTLEFSGDENRACGTGGQCKSGYFCNEAKSCEPIPKRSLTIHLAGDGIGTVTSAPTGLICSSSPCVQEVLSSTEVTLTALPRAGSSFQGWSAGVCSGMNPCKVEMKAAQTITATFRPTYSLTVMVTGTGGTVTSTPAGLSCASGTCTASFPSGTRVTLKAQSARGSFFQGWSGGWCSATGTCTVTMASAKQVTASFGVGHELTVSLAGEGGGGVVSAPPGINCPGICTASFPAGTSVSLTANPRVGSYFPGWSDTGCSGAGACTVTMASAKQVTASFKISYELTLSLAGVGGGGVVSTPPGINCPGTCTASFPAGTAVSLTASPRVGYYFPGWSDAGCSGTGACTVGMTSAKQVTASFGVSHELTVSLAGGGRGGVVSTPPGIDCPGTCTARFPAGTAVSLTASPGLGSYFPGWSGQCQGSSRSCTLSMSAPRAVTANLAEQTHNLVFVSSVRYPADLGSVEAYNARCNALATAAGLNNEAGTAFVALMHSSTRSLNTLLGSARGFVRVDGRPFADTLPSNAILNPLRLDENGNVVDGFSSVWTGSGGQSTCEDWTTASSTKFGTCGDLKTGLGKWLAKGACYCTDQKPIYCAMLTKNTPLSITATPGKQIFVSNDGFLPSEGIATADALCNASRPAGTGTARALLPQNGRSAWSLLDPSANYVRPDGQLVGTGFQLSGHQLESGIWQTGSGTYVDTLVIVGAGSLTRSDGTLTCGNWTNSSGNTSHAFTVTTYGGWHSVGWNSPPSCGTRAPIYCFEQ